ncbi:MULTISPECIES: hypothetical protein [unclassified Arthrobacter]|uniref:hypothetical protein n=1 Tax=unclassified Arthrobacter TaxID=235627 RepID=UPI001319C33B|nr:MULTISPECIES: hypothetical protein [unclassified Arthrobacter]MDT0194572.1 hypothetical protein [Arthrobacter sp. AB6]
MQAAPSAEAEDSATPSATATGLTASPPPTGASSGRDWNTPVTKSAKATRVAAVAPDGDSGGGPALLPVIAGILLLGAAAASFAWWGRNRLRAH